jgi:hypothetical protein
MCIVHSTLRDATTPYTERWQPLKRKNNKYENMFFNVPMGTGYKR